MNLLESNATEIQSRGDRLSHLSVCVVHLRPSLPSSPPLLPVGSRPAVRSAVSHGRRRTGGGRARAGDVNQPRVRGFAVGRRVIRAGLAGARARGGLAGALLFSSPPSLPRFPGGGASGGVAGSVNSAVVGIIVGSRFADVVVGRFHELDGGFILVLSLSLSRLSTWIVLVWKSERAARAGTGPDPICSPNRCLLWT